MTDTLTITGEYAYANGMESGWVPWLIKQKTSASEALYLVGGKYLLWLVGCLGFEPRLAIWVKIQALRWGLHTWGWEYGPCPVFASNYALAFTLQLRKITVKPLSFRDVHRLMYGGPQIVVIMIHYITAEIVMTIMSNFFVFNLRSLV